MDFKQRLQDISDFLQPYQRIWQNEIMLLYPDPLKDYPTDWVKELAQFRDKANIIRLEKKEVQGLLHTPSLLAFYKRVEELSQVPPAPLHPPMPEGPFTYLHMIPKKQYEIKKVAPLIHHLYQLQNVERIIDIGGGIGLLAQTIANQYGLKVTSVDLDPVLQKTGKERNEKNAPLERRIEYVTEKVTADNMNFQSLFTDQRMSVGLHTCGALANHQLRVSAQHKLKAMVNFGCCYHKEPEEQNISEFARAQHAPLNMTRFALTLACRAHRKMDEKGYDLKLKVKLYRYAIHFLLHDEYGRKELSTLGNSHPKLYDESFGTYALEQLKRIKVEIKHTKEELDAYFQDEERQELIWKMLAAGLIRNTTGRLLEIYLLLDRAIYLEEQGYQVQLLEFFDEEISPRNLGIVATLL